MAMNNSKKRNEVTFVVPPKNKDIIAEKETEVKVLVGKDLKISKDGGINLCASHPFKGAIVLALGQPWMLNRLSFVVGKNGKLHPYKVSVSFLKENKDDWTQVCDYSNIQCHGLQNIYFRPRAVRFIKIEGVLDNPSDVFIVSSIKVFNDCFHGITSVDPKWSLMPAKQSRLIIDIVSGKDCPLEEFGYSLNKLAMDIYEIRFCQPTLIKEFHILLPTEASWDPKNGRVSILYASGEEETVMDNVRDFGLVSVVVQFSRHKPLLMIEVRGLDVWQTVKESDDEISEDSQDSDSESAEEKPPEEKPPQKGGCAIL